MPDELSVLSWNIGFSRLGQLPTSPIAFGKSMFGMEKKEISQRCNEIATFLRKVDCDIYSLQEVCSASILNSWVPVRNMISHALPQHSEVFLEDFRAGIWVTQCLASHGQSVHTKLQVHEQFKLQLPQVQVFNPIHRLKEASANVVRLNLSGTDAPITIVSVHLAASDDRIQTKKRQIQDVLGFANSEFSNGRYVLICGDFNYCVASCQAASLDNLDSNRARAFPRKYLPNGWALLPDLGSLVDTKFHSGAETLQVSVIDGLILSPNLTFERLDLLNHSPALSDHPALHARLNFR